MKVLLTGAHGQLATELAATKPDHIELGLAGRADCDVTDLDSVRKTVNSFEPEVVVNCAGYTAVDAAETNSERAFAVNATGAGNVARASGAAGARLVHISTDYVFDGARDTPYPPDALPNPLNVYGESKLEGEREVFLHAERAVVVRTGWLYSARGSNFLLTMLDAMRRDGIVRVVSDQKGCPTWAGNFAEALWACVANSTLLGLYHWSSAGSASWYEFAVAIDDLATKLGLLPESAKVLPATSSEMGRPARRPRYSVLDSSKLASALGISQKPWNLSLAQVMADIRGPKLNNARAL